MREQLIYSFADAPTPQCHASTVAELPNGTICAAWFGGTHEKNPDVCIWFSRRNNGIWEKPRCVADSPVPHWNPVLFLKKLLQIRQRHVILTSITMPGHI